MDKNDTVIAVFPDHQAALKADGYLVMAHGTPEEVAHAKTILDTVHPSQLDLHSSATIPDAADQTLQASA